MKFEHFFVIGIILIFLLSIYPLAIFNSPNGQTTGADANLSFLDLNDTPNAYTGQANRFVSVNASETGLQFTLSTPTGDTNCSLNSNCILTGRLNSGFDANVLDINSVGESNFTGSNAGTPPVTITNKAGSGSDLVLTLVSGTSPLATLSQAFGVAFGFFCNTIGAPVACFFGYDLSNVIVVSPSTLASSWTDPDGILLLGPTNIQSTGDVDLSLNVDGNQTIHGSLGATVDRNVNTRDLNAQNTIYGNTIGSRDAINAAGTITGNIVNSANSITYETNLNMSTGQAGWTTNRDSDSNYLISANSAHGFIIDTNNTQTGNNFMLDGNGGAYFPKIRQTSAVLNGIVINKTSGEIFERISDSSFKLNQTISDVNSQRLYELNLIEWTDKTTGLPGIGFLAEDVCAKIPELCIYDSGGQPYSFDHVALGLVQNQELKRLKQKEDIMQAFICSQPTGQLACQQLQALSSGVVLPSGV